MGWVLFTLQARAASLGRVLLEPVGPGFTRASGRVLYGPAARPGRVLSTTLLLEMTKYLPIEKLSNFDFH